MLCRLFKGQLKHSRNEYTPTMTSHSINNQQQQKRKRKCKLPKFLFTSAFLIFKNIRFQMKGYLLLLKGVFCSFLRNLHMKKLLLLILLGLVLVSFGQKQASLIVMTFYLSR